MYPRILDPSVLGFILSLHRYPLTCILSISLYLLFIIKSVTSVSTPRSFHPSSRHLFLSITPRPSHRPPLGTHRFRHLLSSTSLPSTLSWYPPRSYRLRLSSFYNLRRCVIGTPLPRSSPHPWNVVGISRGRIPITVYLM